MRNDICIEILTEISVYRFSMAVADALRGMRMPEFGGGGGEEVSVLVLGHSFYREW